MQKITPFLWYDKEAGEAAKFYVSVFKGSKIKKVQTMENTPSGTVEIISMDILGTEFGLMSAGPLFKFNESVSFIVNCESQEEVDYYWEALTADGGQESQCGWLKDKFGLSWQITPTILNELIGDPDPVKRARVTQAMLKMKKIDISLIKQAYEQ